ncbi:hypothetical protein KQ41_20070 [Lysinibacillus fusiformis]|uniref:hypothetical protein n=1 Tax=Lysinibacillus fusiformis TaxID=28031 RepID=UPI0005070C42|nr:hypothetical protein [Lysinibacillus fusiformis]KGA81106.1 hypothetical protein KQ41_20070 [Lysinibacillus fusiformis]
MSVKDEVKAEQQRMIKERMEQRKTNGYKKVKSNDDSPSNIGYGCGTWLIIGFVLIVITLIYDWNFGERDYHDPSDWNFDGEVDQKDAEMKLDRILNNEK